MDLGGKMCGQRGRMGKSKLKCNSRIDNVCHTASRDVTSNRIFGPPLDLIQSRSDEFLIMWADCHFLATFKRNLVVLEREKCVISRKLNE
jgi:hypothetical protein